MGKIPAYITQLENAFKKGGVTGIFKAMWGKDV
jgi:hypothetical protein